MLFRSFLPLPAGGGFFGLGAGAGARGEEESGFGVPEKGIAENAEGSGGIAKSAGGLLGGAALDVIGAERLVLALFGMTGLEEESGRVC